MPEPIGIVLLCAGRGTRFGPEPKLLSLLDGKPLVRHAAETALASGLGPVVVVLGAEILRIRGALGGLALDLVENPLHTEGLSTSLQVGLDALGAGIAGVIVMLGDMPRIRPDHLHGLAAAFRAAVPRPAAIVPLHAGRRGNPVLINRALLGSCLASLTGDHGAGPLLAGRHDVVEIAMDEAVRQDIDTPADLARA
ncbi:NTP transferase domain-containing protein [uncultured Methylobacterium sp.]|uniref:nucleotidyltransferase family protein n=1 Tax=uncultured Methylobacterium sp. TaxID=157278 RepID=UPI0035CC7D85